MKTYFANTWKNPETGSFFIPFPAVVFNKEASSNSIAIGWLIWAVEFTFEKRPQIAEKYVTCINNRSNHLTIGKDYEVLEEKNNFYKVKSDDLGIIYVERTLFSEPFNKWS